MFEEVRGELDDRTPAETSMLDSIVVTDSQYQVWVHRELKGTFLTKGDAQEAAAHSWEHKGYPNVRFRKVYPASKYWLLEVESPAGDRWMTSDTFILEINVAAARGIPYYGS